MMPPDHEKLVVLILFATSVAAQTITNQTTTRLIDSGDGPIMPIPAGATDPAEPRVAALNVTVPNGHRGS